MWTNLAAVSKEEAKPIRIDLEKSMTPEQIAEGQRLTREWITSHPHNAPDNPDHAPDNQAEERTPSRGLAPAPVQLISPGSGPCAKNISFAVAEGGQIVSRAPQFTQKWIKNNQKHYPGLCFSQIPDSTAINFVLVFSTSQSSFNGIFPTVRTQTSSNTSPVS